MEVSCSISIVKVNFLTLGQMYLLVESSVENLLGVSLAGEITESLVCHFAFKFNILTKLRKVQL